MYIRSKSRLGINIDNKMEHESVNESSNSMESNSTGSEIEINNQLGMNRIYDEVTQNNENRNVTTEVRTRDTDTKSKHRYAYDVETNERTLKTNE